MTPSLPPLLRPGDTVAVLSPSSAGPYRFPRVYELGLRNLREGLGVKVRELSTARMSPQELDEDPRRRAEDLNAAFTDPEVRAIVASLGGDDSVRILPYLDLSTIRANPKILMGFSDTTTLTTWLAQQGLVTFNGPSVLAGFAQMGRLPAEFGAHVRAMLTEPRSETLYTPYPLRCDGYGDWNRSDYDGETQPLVANSGPRWLQGAGVHRGRLFGGCIEVLEFLKATPFWPGLDFWNGRILFFETSEDVPSVSQVKWMLRNYGSMGALDRISGLLFGRARGYTDAAKEELEAMIVKVVAREFGRTDLPIVANADFGHTDPQWVLPLNVTAELDCEARTFRLVEPCVA